MTKITRRSFMAGTAGFLAVGSLPMLGGSRVAAASTTKAKSATPFDLDQFIADVKRARSEADGSTAVREVLARTVSEPGSVLRELGEPTEAGIKTLYKDDKVSIFNIVWGPLMVLAPHNHLMWVNIGIYTGREDNIIWQPVGKTIEASTAASLSEKEVFSLPDTGIHSVTNPIRKLTGAIHVYGGDLTTARRSQWDAETLREKPFDFAETQRRFQEANERMKNGG